MPKMRNEFDVLLKERTFKHDLFTFSFRTEKPIEYIHDQPVFLSVLSFVYSFRKVLLGSCKFVIKFDPRMWRSASKTGISSKIST